MLSLEQTPKLIGFFKQWDPDVFLVGFKLLRDVPEAELIRAGEELAEKNGCDLVLLNDQAQISGSRHMGLLLQNGSVIGRYETKHEIAAAIAAAIVQDAREKQKKVIGGGV
jgi:phosphopantothenoylcysteine synthetase/decarboxylase